MKAYLQINRNKVCCAIAVMIAGLLTIGVARQMELHAAARMQETQRSLAREVLRFHVLANSDSDRDQRLKMEVKEAIMELMREELPHSESLDQTVQWAVENAEEIRSLAESIVRSSGYELDVDVRITRSYFPDTTYGDVKFPAGKYQALRVEIGQARGRNWWCVLYPNLCFIDATHVVISEEGMEELEYVLTEEEIETITATTRFRVRSFFRWW